MKKFVSTFMVLVFLLTLFCSCSSKKTDAVSTTKPVTQAKVKLATLMGPTGMGMAYMLYGSDNGTTKNSYDYTVCASPDEITGKIVSGEFDIAALPTNAAATLYNKTNGKIKLLGLNTGCVLYVVENGNTIKDIKDLKGKTVYVSGQGSTPEYIFEYLLSKNGLEVGTDVKLDFTYSTHNDLVAFAASGKADVVLLPEPTVTALLVKNKDMRVALALDDLWTEGNVSMGCVVVNSDFAAKNPQAVKDFLLDYKDSVEKVTDTENLDEAADVIAKVGIVAAPAVAKNALPRCKIILKTGTDMKTEIESFLNVLYKANPNSVGGKMPDENFYYAG